MPSIRNSDGLALLRQDILMHSKTITALVDSQAQANKLVQELITDREVRQERDLRWNEKFDTMGKDIQTLKRGVAWVLSVFALVLLTAVGNFIVSGGLVERDNTMQRVIEQSSE